MKNQRQPTNTQDIDVLALATRAAEKGIDTPDRVKARLLAILARNIDYLAYRERSGYVNAYNATVKEDNEVLAMACVLLDSTQAVIEQPSPLEGGPLH